MGTLSKRMRSESLVNRLLSQFLQALRKEFLFRKVRVVFVALATVVEGHVVCLKVGHAGDAGCAHGTASGNFLEIVELP